MNLPAHLLIGAVAFARPNVVKVNFAALLGSIAPDVSLFVLSGWSIYVLGIAPARVFDELYFSQAWQQVFAIDNSVFLWGLILGLGIWLKRGWIQVFAGAGLLHLLADFPLHNDDARAYFWPLSDWVFYSPLSYWDPRHYGNIIGPLEIAMSLILGIILWRRFSGWRVRLALLSLAVLQMAPSILFRLLMDGSHSAL